ncbi:MAG: hypothetical protein EBR02_03955 [Alphaproteobacteria bacterium]|nr:hypothetical protein [Alphaproteobacteria bacterium]
MTTLAMDDMTQNEQDFLGFDASLEVELSEELLARKFLRPANRLHDVVYEVTNDVGYLHQYYLLRGEMYVRSFGSSHYCGSADSYDEISDIVIARIGNQVIGGCRMTYCHPASPRRLPMEKALVLGDYFPELPLQDVIHLEISRMAILPEFQNSLAMIEIIRQMFKRAADMKARFAFAISPLAFARNYRKAVALFGLDWQIRRDIEVPADDYDGLRMVMSVIDLAPIYVHKAKAAEERKNQLVS